MWSKESGGKQELYGMGEEEEEVICLLIDKKIRYMDRLKKEPATQQHNTWNTTTGIEKQKLCSSAPTLLTTHPRPRWQWHEHA